MWPEHAWRSTDRRAVPDNVCAQYRRSSLKKTVALATSITQKSHAFAHLFPLASMHLANPPQPSCNGQRSSGNSILRAVHVYRVYLILYLIKMHPQVCGLSWGLLAGKYVFFSMLQPMFAPTAHAQVWRVFGHGHENLLISALVLNVLP